MERVMSVEEKIRRAEEIYERRRQGENRNIAKVTVNDKKDIKLLKKMIIQILVCVAVYLIIYTINNNQYVFSEDFMNKVNEILCYDTNFAELYYNIQDGIKQLIQKTEEVTPEDSIGGAEETSEDNQIDDIQDSQEQNEDVQNSDQTAEEQADNETNNEENQIQSEEKNIEDAIGGAEETENKPLSQIEQDIINIKNTTTFIKPIEGAISSKYGIRETATGKVPKNHTGTDIAANLGTKIKSATDGEVVLASSEGDYGKHLKVQIGEVSIIYAHCNNLYVEQGEKIVQGQEIAEVGSTGNSTGPHLHFEIRISERTVDPESILEL